MKHSLLRSLTLVMFSLIVSACGKTPQVVTGVQVSTSTVNADVMLSFKADLDLGNMSFPSVSLPILHPHGQTPIGSVDLNPVLGGKNQLSINVNLSELAHIQAAVATLPNGNPIPLIASNPTVVIALGAGARLYLTASGSVTAIGVAIPIKTFDSIGQTVGGINFFPNFTIDKVLGAAGLFTSKTAGQNGFALVADVSAYVKIPDSSAPSMALIQAQESQDVMKLNYASQIPAKAQENKINSMIYNLNRQGKRLELHR